MKQIETKKQVTGTHLERVDSPSDCPYHHPDLPYCSKKKGVVCYSNSFPNDCPLEIVDESEFEE